MNGFDKVPDRYAGCGREVIDRMRDAARVAASTDFGLDLESLVKQGDVEGLGDMLFAMHCRLTAMKYQYRAGAKGDEEGDVEKQAFYQQMADHVLGADTPDPRASRPNFEPYAYPHEVSNV